MKQADLIRALNRPGHELGILPALAALRPQFELHIYDTLPSTNRTAWEWIAQGKGAGTVVIATQQTAGRGQQGRSWMSAPGGLYLSLVLEPELASSEATVLTCASAWGIATALNRLGYPLRLKWPNDLVWQGRKLGGILTETRLSGSASPPPLSAPSFRYVVVGLGMNWQNPIPENAITFSEISPDSGSMPVNTLEQLAAIALRGILQGYYYWQQEGTSALLAAYTQALYNLGQIVEVDGEPAQVLGVSERGELAIAVNLTGVPVVQYLKPGEKRLGYNV